MRHLLLLGLGILLGACQSTPATETDNSAMETTDTTATAEPALTPDNLIVPGQGFGPIKAGMTTATLKKLLSEQQIKDEAFYLGEGYSEPGLLLYPGTARELSVHLVSDTLNLVQLTRNGSAWQTAEGITIGSTLAEVVAANGRDFKLTGFDWDYGGTVTDWQAGALGGKDLLMRFTIEYGTARVPDADIQAIAGDQIISSANPSLAKYLVTVSEITQRQP